MCIMSLSNPTMCIMSLSNPTMCMSLSNPTMCIMSLSNLTMVDPAVCPVYGLGLWPLDCLDRGFVSR
jgi:hypothetical protein